MLKVGRENFCHLFAEKPGALLGVMDAIVADETLAPL
jgi:hypothetical protein